MRYIATTFIILLTSSVVAHESDVNIDLNIKGVKCREIVSKSSLVKEFSQGGYFYGKYTYNDQVSCSKKLRINPMHFQNPKAHDCLCKGVVTLESYN
ncbi:MAG: hypothetical protein BM556_01625 [Bacteriovorax sp. MedPE-SWde]|nr:MAG: hypothetical protein BM556_01625 [Bacteriovorax sp. MedPE-SWde]